MERGHTGYAFFSKPMASELGQERWSVISDRGCEATGLTHESARRMVHRLGGEGRHGLCIISDEAASRLDRSPVKKSPCANSPSVQK